jgi:DNA ligase-1
MLRRADKPVAMKRSKDLIKVKLFQEDEFECVDTYEGEGKYQGSLGGITCVTKDGVRFGVGSGFSDGERDTIWKNLDPRGKLITVRYFRFTNDGVPYLPTFRAIRPEQDIVS